MKSVAILLLSCLSLSAQSPLITGSGIDWTVPVSSSASPGPQTLSGLAYYWVSSDLTVGPAVSNWVDRIQGAVWTNGASAQRPTNSVTGIYFDGVNNKLTNNVLNLDATKLYTWFCIVKCMRNNQIADGFWTVTGGSGPGFDFSNNPGFGAVVDPNSLAADFREPTGVFQDWIIPITGGASTPHSYTNNVVAKAAALPPLTSGTTLMSSLAGLQGGGAQGNFYLTEFGIFTNDLSTNAANRTVLHTYATNSSAAAPYQP